jgi:hypothetical protein
LEVLYERLVHLRNPLKLLKRVLKGGFAAVVVAGMCVCVCLFAHSHRKGSLKFKVRFGALIETVANQGDCQGLDSRGLIASRGALNPEQNITD